MLCELPPVIIHSKLENLLLEKSSKSTCSNDRRFVLMNHLRFNNKLYFDIIGKMLWLLDEKCFSRRACDPRMISGLHSTKNLHQYSAIKRNRKGILRTCYHWFTIVSVKFWFGSHERVFTMQRITLWKKLYRWKKTDDCLVDEIKPLMIFLKVSCVSKETGKEKKSERLMKKVGFSKKFWLKCRIISAYKWLRKRPASSCKKLSKPSARVRQCRCCCQRKCLWCCSDIA